MSVKSAWALAATGTHIAAGRCDGCHAPRRHRLLVRIQLSPDLLGVKLLRDVNLGPLGAVRLAGRGSAVGLLLCVLGHDALVMGSHLRLWDALGTENLEINRLAAWEGIFDLFEDFLVDLLHVHAQACFDVSASSGKLVRGEKLTAGGVEAPRASVTLEVFCLLVVDQDLEVIKVALAVVAPGPREEVIDLGVLALLLFGHGC